MLTVTLSWLTGTLEQNRAIINVISKTGAYLSLRKYQKIILCGKYKAAGVDEGDQCDAGQLNLLIIKITKHAAEVLIEVSFCFLLLDNHQICAASAALVYQKYRLKDKCKKITVDMHSKTVPLL